VVGIMPHPERIAEGVLGPPDGLGFFRSLAAWRPRASTLNVPSR
jgi:phosphoribosylformylglycinamidine (FGAM) synthase-like amidotransferase family enzyme